uniref:Ubiquitin-like domain-containing protein n=2 Tax=Rhizophora mucronata TaxID=61149 RepID=A0A2P2IWJ8_RHIMU
MGEIVEEVEDNKNSNINSNGDVNNGEEARTRRRREIEDMKNMVEITLKTIGPSPPSRLLVPSPIKVRDLRKLIAENNRLPIESLKLIFRGNVVNDSKDDDDVYLRLNNNDSVMVAVKPKPPAKHLQDGFDFEDDDLKFRLPQSTSRWKRKLYSFLHDELKVPDILLMALFTLSLKVWVFIILWFILAPVAYRWDLGPLYILGTGFSIIFLNLGRREAGDLSAYSIFNEEFRELPGTLNADRLDRDIRVGQF